MSLLEVALNLGIENFSIGSSDEYIFQVNFSLFIFWNVLLVFGTVRSDDMSAYFFRASGQDVLFHFILLFVLLLTVVICLCLLFFLGLLFHLWDLLLTLELCQIVIFRLWGTAILLLQLFPNGLLELCLAIIVVLLLMFYFDFVNESFVLFLSFI